MSSLCFSTESQKAKEYSGEHREISKNSERSTSQHVWGFYLYSIAYEIYAIVSTSIFLPIVLEQFSRDNAFIYPSYTDPCPDSSKIHWNDTLHANDDQISQKIICKTQLWGKWINVSTFPLYVSSITLACQALMLTSMSSAADDEHRRKFLLVAFAICGSFSATLFFIIDSSFFFWQFVALFALISNTALSASTVCLNSLLPGIAKEKALEQVTRSANDEQHTPYADKSLVSTYISQISAKGVAFGFSSGILALCLSLLLVYARDGDLKSMRCVIGISALCWGFLTLPAAYLLPPSKMDFKRCLANPFQLRKSLQEIIRMLKGYSLIIDLIKFLLAWFFLSNAFSTITSFAILYGKNVLKMKISHLVCLGVITPTLGILGALILPLIQERISYFSGTDSTLKMFKAIIFLTSLIPLWISFSFVLTNSALNNERDIFILAGVFGFFYGGFQSYSRSVYTELLPQGQEAKWNSLYSITAKLSSFTGPLVIGVITEMTNEMRYGFCFISILFTCSFPLLQLINIQKKEDSINLFT
ncbi:hypothetical protein O181_011655 [Austropuccinia psidii MF-1]|uniref:Autophagy-related protein n=1 Tax=Austropuccinia psidii MF-1 TaxID=1389203 RepID=A0A9Q3GM45_9BASI|nr:hypothetical protein [Austropuccinia psidii MF-1]